MESDRRTSVGVASGSAEAGAKPLLEARGVTMRFGGLVAVNAVDLSIEPGTITSLIGPNGAGKTTLFNLIAGFYRPTQGNIRFLGTEVAGRRPHEITRL